MEQAIESTRRFRAGYHIHYGKWKMEGPHPETGEPDDWTPMRWAVNPAGHYIGDSRRAFRLCQKRGIRPELADPGDNVCSIGFSEKDQKWYGWSHRALWGFGIGDIAKEGDCCTESAFVPEYAAAHPELDKTVPVGFEAKTLADCRRMAVAFAESVG